MDWGSRRKSRRFWVSRTRRCTTGSGPSVVPTVADERRVDRDCAPSWRVGGARHPGKSDDVLRECAAMKYAGIERNRRHWPVSNAGARIQGSVKVQVQGRPDSNHRLPVAKHLLQRYNTVGFTRYRVTSARCGSNGLARCPGKASRIGSANGIRKSGATSRC